MQPTIFALSGKGGCGKTYTIKKVYEKLATQYKLQNIRITDLNDISGTFEIDGILIGIESQGDPGTDLAGRLRHLKNEGCKIIICATRTNGETIDDVISYRPFYQTCWDRQEYVALNERDKNNDLMADSFVHKISELLKSYTK